MGFRWGRQRESCARESRKLPCTLHICHPEFACESGRARDLMRRRERHGRRKGLHIAPLKFGLNGDLQIPQLCHPDRSRSSRSDDLRSGGTCFLPSPSVREGRDRVGMDIRRLLPLIRFPLKTDSEPVRIFQGHLLHSVPGNLRF